MQRLHQVASLPRAKELLYITAPSDDTDYSLWGERVYNDREIDIIITNSQLVVTKATVNSISNDSTAYSSSHSSDEEESRQNATLLINAVHRIQQEEEKMMQTDEFCPE